MVGKEDKAGVTVMISSKAAGTTIALQAITLGAAQAAHGKFVNSDKGYNEEDDGYKDREDHPFVPSHALRQGISSQNAVGLSRKAVQARIAQLAASCNYLSTCAIANQPAVQSLLCYTH